MCQTWWLSRGPHDGSWHSSRQIGQRSTFTGTQNLNANGDGVVDAAEADMGPGNQNNQFVDDNPEPQGPHDQEMLDREEEVEEEVEEEEPDHSDDEGDFEEFPACYPSDPPVVDRVPFIDYPADAPRSSPSDRNREFNRQLRANFVPYSKGMKLLY